jgi:hypothetical protein
MLSTAHHLPTKTSAARMAAASYDTAVALREHSAAFVSFQWQQPNLPPTQNVNSVDCSLAPACHFSGNHANCAVFAAIAAF